MGYFEENVSHFGFGLMRLPRKEGAIDVEQVKQMVDMFIGNGGTYFDTARAYDGSEAAIREALVERYPRDAFYLATKNAAWLGADTEEDAKRFFDESLEATGAGYFDFYLLHNLGGPRTEVFDRFGMWDFVRDLKESGKVRHVGFSMHDTAETLDAILTEHPEMEFVQLQVNYADWESGNVQSKACCEVARAHGKPIVIMEPVRGGTLANPPASVAQLLKEEEPDASYVSWALRFALGVEGVMTVLSGMSSLEQMADNLVIWKDTPALSEHEREVLEKAQAMIREAIAVPCTACHYCMPGCPMGIDIADIMDAVNREGLYGHANAQNGYNFATRSGVRASDCIGCAQCEAACPQHIPIIENLAKAASLFE